MMLNCTPHAKQNIPKYTAPLNSRRVGDFVKKSWLKQSCLNNIPTHYILQSVVVFLCVLSWRAIKMRLVLSFWRTTAIYYINILDSPLEFGRGITQTKLKSTTNWELETTTRLNSVHVWYGRKPSGSTDCFMAPKSSWRFWSIYHKHEKACTGSLLSLWSGRILWTDWYRLGRVCLWCSVRCFDGVKRGHCRHYLQQLSTTLW